jgi:enoyl-CoA hydratase/carnithine racemase
LRVARQERVLQLTLNRPEKRNALRIEDCRQIVAILNEAELDDGIGAILLDSAGPDFCAGMDLSESLEEDAGVRAAIHDELLTIGSRYLKPFVVAVQGRALAGGLGLVASAHVAIAAEDAGFGLPEIRIGFWPFIVFRAVAVAIGERRALELSLTGRVIGAGEAMLWGLVHHVAPAGEIRARAAAAATVLSRFSPEATRRGLDFVHRTRAASAKEAMELADSARRRSFGSADFAEGVSAFFEKREPRWPSLWSETSGAG